jgi:hypothetical protein
LTTTPVDPAAIWARWLTTARGGGTRSQS